MAVAGFSPRGGLQVDTPGFVRFDAPGDKAGKGNGFYKLKLGQYPVGWFGDWKQGAPHQWFYHDESRGELTADERRAIKREQARLKAEAAQAREAKQAEIAEDASRMWKAADGNVEGHPYLERKRIAMPRGLRSYQARDGTRLIAVPMYAFDMNGQPQLTSLQLIDPEGQKRFLKAGRVEGTFFSLKGDASIIVLCEGVATAFSIWEATGLSVVAAFNGGNLIEVARDFARWRPLAKLLIAGDDDVIAPEDWAERGGGRPWVNAGRKKAEAAAKAVGCRWIVPQFADGAARSRTDFNDLHLVEDLEQVKRQVGGAFKAIEAEDAAPGATIVEFDQVQDESWRSAIPLTSAGSKDGGNVEGVAIYIANHKHLRGRLRFNEHTKEMELDGNEMQDHHVAGFRRIMHHDRFKARKSDVQDEMEAEARRESYDPLTAYLACLKWDGQRRLDTMLIDYFGAANTPYARIVGRRFMIGSVARAMNPGCKLDTMLVLEGPQGGGKSTSIRYLYGDRFFVDNLPDFHSKDSFQQLQGAWCVEVAELSALSKADVKDVKQFLSRLVDKFRAPYARSPISVPRRTVFVGTVNPEDGGYLRDPTGNRRFWPVECGAIYVASILKDRDQLWAEAMVAYAAGERWHLEEDEVPAAQAEQDKRREVHPWTPIIELWLAINPREMVTISQVLTDAVKLAPDKQEPRHSRQVGACMRALGWKDDRQRPTPGAKPAVVFRLPDSTVRTVTTAVPDDDSLPY